MSTFEIWSDSTLPKLEVTVIQKQTAQRTTPYDLSNLVSAVLTWIGDDDVVQTRNMTVVDATEGEHEYEWLLTDTENPGYFDMHIKLTFNDGTILIVTEKPNKKDKLHIRNSEPNIC